MRALCVGCITFGYCRKMTSEIVTDKELENAVFRADVRSTAAALDIDPSQWLDFVTDLYMHYRGRIVDRNGQEVFLDMEVFEVPHIREWIRDWLQRSIDDPARSRLRCEARERLRAIATILRAAHPDQAMLWGLRPANDSRPPEGR